MAKIVFELNLDDEAETLLQAATRVAHNAMALAQSVQSDIALPQNDEQVVSHETFLHEHNMIVLMEAGPRANIGQASKQQALCPTHPGHRSGQGGPVILPARPVGCLPEIILIAARSAAINPELHRNGDPVDTEWRLDAPAS